MNATNNGERSNSQLVISYLSIRKIIGLLGMSLPIILVLGTFLFGSCTEVLDSISAYYHSVMRNVFVGVLCAIALFLYCYRGYDMYDFISWKLAGIFAVCIAMFPTDARTAIMNLDDADIKSSLAACEIPSLTIRPWVGMVHLISAALFFLTLAYISWFLFTKSNKEVLGKKKKIRNQIYRLTAVILILSLILIGIYMLWFRGQSATLDHYDPVFWLESIGLFAFGLAWITKGEMLFGD